MDSPAISELVVNNVWYEETSTSCKCTWNQRWEEPDKSTSDTLLKHTTPHLSLSILFKNQIRSYGLVTAPHLHLIAEQLANTKQDRVAGGESETCTTHWFY